MNALDPDSGPEASRRCAALEAENRELDFRRALDVQGFVADISLVRQQQAATARRAPCQPYSSSRSGTARR